ncbi:MAG: UDP-N-acetylmuramoyl-L-alanyl-D-glutamate--2,6-diaminopimelate ligase [Acidobacteria bacterium]|nr:UDP-N-acetylmuramoyl-L-alanyl-D-glutamate--2,6-diaminopimelate ligase [Acidobacteriota bacterium]
MRRLPSAVLTGDAGIEVTGIHHDSRRLEPGQIFAAMPGEHRHGLDFLGEALGRGAAAVLTDREPPEGVTAAWITTASPRAHMALAAWALAGDPQRRLELVGITGTNGKSTVAGLVASMLEAAGRPAGLFGTLEYRFAGMRVPAPRTTPEATDLAPKLARIVAEGGDVAVMEVSSHAIALDRVAGLDFDVAVFTNLSRDHLDYHRTMDAYFATKKRLFTELLAPDGRRVLPSGDRWGTALGAEPRAGDVTWGLDDADVTASAPRYSLDGTSFELRTPAGSAGIVLPLIGEHNLENALAAAAAGFALGLPFEAISRALNGARPLPGRLEPVRTELAFPVYIDFAHTPDGLRAVLRALRRVTDRRLIVVFGAGGDRDRGKRRPMGRAAGELADDAIVTSDNPRTEDPAAIAREVAAGVREAGMEPAVILDRREAIATALKRADASSLVLVAGKGHETDQEIGGRRLPFSDVQVIHELAGGAS